MNRSGPIFNGWTDTNPNYLTVFLPVYMPGFGEIQNRNDWVKFRAWLQIQVDNYESELEQKKLEFMIKLYTPD